jgi:ribonuclease HII
VAILAGIDEAGFGPTLGPLVVSGVIFRVPDDRLDQCLWGTLRATCASRVGRRGHRLVIADSKQLYRSRGSLQPLERAALVMLAVSGHRPASWHALLESIAPHAIEQLALYPWYVDAAVPLPVNEDIGDIATQANAIRRDCARQGVALCSVLSEPLPAGHFNRLVKSTRNKAVVLLGLVLRIVDRIMRFAPGERVRLHVDRLGGRAHYRDALMTALSGYDLQVLEESATRSAYRLCRASRTCEIDFVTTGEGRHLPVALASVYSKYQRELYMHAFNRYWSGQITGLRPTAGYYSDAHRWLDEAAPELERRSVDRTLLVRER